MSSKSVSHQYVSECVCHCVHGGCACVRACMRVCVCVCVTVGACVCVRERDSCQRVV